MVPPGVPRTHPLYIEAIKRGIEVIGEVELACRYLKGQVVGVTGTNGKTTVTLLIEHILRHAGKDVVLLGNGGVPITSEDASAKIVVLELSSFQLETMVTPVLDAAAVLNITSDHLDRYDGMEEYAKAKMHIRRCLKPDGKLYVEENTLKQWGYLLEGFPCFSIAGQKTHDEENFMFAAAICQQLGIDYETIVRAYSIINKPPHRIEFVEKINGVSYYDDSKGTNLDAVIRCIQSLPSSIILIAGGVHKGAPYTSWIEPFRGKVKMIMTIGQAAPLIESDLQSHFPIRECRDLADAVETAQKVSIPGDSIGL